MKICRGIFIIIVIVVLALVSVWEKNRITKSGYEISSLQKRKIDLIEENRLLELQISKQLSGERIYKVIAAMDLHYSYSLKIINKERLLSKADVINDLGIREF